MVHLASCGMNNVVLPCDMCVKRIFPKFPIINLTDYSSFASSPGDLGVGKASIQYHVHREALSMVELLNKSVGQPMDLNSTLNIAITNIVWSIVAGDIAAIIKHSLIQVIRH